HYTLSEQRSPRGTQKRTNCVQARPVPPLCPLPALPRKARLDRLCQRAAFCVKQESGFVFAGESTHASVGRLSPLLHHCCITVAIQAIQAAQAIAASRWAKLSNRALAICRLKEAINLEEKRRYVGGLSRGRSPDAQSFYVFVPSGLQAKSPATCQSC
ncbi:MAG: hypothetical protein V3V80_00175, partial [Dehalococcoidia bacterium]